MNNLPVFDYEDIQLVPNKCIINSPERSGHISKAWGPYL
jgi:hypothetical protein